MHRSNIGDLAKGVEDLGNEYKVTTFALHKSQKIIKTVLIFIINELTFYKWKNWILKKYNQEEISYLKDNFSLDEITSKLIINKKN